MAVKRARPHVEESSSRKSLTKIALRFWVVTGFFCRRRLRRCLFRRFWWNMLKRWNDFCVDFKFASRDWESLRSESKKRSLRSKYYNAILVIISSFTVDNWLALLPRHVGCSSCICIVWQLQPAPLWQRYQLIFFYFLLSIVEEDSSTSTSIIIK